jgi:hypothetical protein
MECLTQRKIIKIIRTVKGLSYCERRKILSEEKKINDLLDTINNFKSALIKKTCNINKITRRIEKLACYGALNQDCMLLMKDVTSSVSDLHSPLMKQYYSMNLLFQHGIATDEITAYKRSIDDLMRSRQTLETIYIFKPGQNGQNSRQLSFN